MNKVVLTISIVVLVLIILVALILVILAWREIIEFKIDFSVFPPKITIMIKKDSKNATQGHVKELSQDKVYFMVESNTRGDADNPNGRLKQLKKRQPY